MPVLNIKVETTDSTLDLLENKMDMDIYEVIDILEGVAIQKLRELREETKEL